MRETHEVAEFQAYLARIEDPILGLLDTLFRSRGPAWHKLFRLCGLATAAEGEPMPAWSRWWETVAKSRQATFAGELGELFRAELERRNRIARESEQLRRNSLSPQDVENLTDAELALVRMILGDAFDSGESRWLLLARLGGLYPRGLRCSTWRKWSRIAEGSEAIKAAAKDLIESEFRRRGLHEVAEVTARPDAPPVSPTAVPAGSSAEKRPKARVGHRRAEASNGPIQ